jgi:hypothetical protein
LVIRLAGWLVGWLVAWAAFWQVCAMDGWLTCVLVGWLVSYLAYWLVCDGWLVGSALKRIAWFFGDLFFSWLDG